MGFLVGNDFIPHLPDMHINMVSDWVEGVKVCMYVGWSSRLMSNVAVSLCLYNIIV